MDRTQKEATIADLHSKLQDVSVVVVTHHLGLTVAEVTDLRVKMRAAGASFKVTKNRLARRALKGTQFEGIDGLFKGPTAIAFSKDPVAAAKVAADYAKSNDKLAIIGGSLNGAELNAEGVKALATLPSLDELRAKIVGMIQTPATRIAGVLQAPGGQVARVLSAYAKKDEAA
ncbi:large subunit ribosomal protein L10 [Azospirillum fermentarium]|uniref:50S ribosomal protein L10 n=1 Tax=Azospirillum fermentarium TaxID=1233114 RepID=UPI002225BFA1|nr:50S ribosomal protein L10 [Azospirillum fermentarium]MCW2245548.1 large subunit ribosomal protein L10 [Azospirillum fermentarium]